MKELSFIDKEPIKKRINLFLGFFCLLGLFASLSFVAFISMSLFKTIDLQNEGYNLFEYPIALLNFYLFFSVFLVFGFLISTIKYFKNTSFYSSISYYFMMSFIFWASIICGIILSDSKKEMILQEANRTQQSLVENSYGFEKSDINKELDIAIQTEDLNRIKNVFSNWKLLKGLSSEQILEKIAIVKSINNNKISDKFSQIYADKFISKAEYEEFKLYAIDEINKTITNENMDISAINKL